MANTPDPTKSPDNLTASVVAVRDLSKAELKEMAKKLETTAATMDEVLAALPALDLDDDERRMIAKLLSVLSGYGPYAQRVLGEITKAQADALLNGAK